MTTTIVALGFIAAALGIALAWTCGALYVQWWRRERAESDLVAARIVAEQTFHKSQADHEAVLEDYDGRIELLKRHRDGALKRQRQLEKLFREQRKKLWAHSRTVADALGNAYLGVSVELCESTFNKLTEDMLADSLAWPVAAEETTDETE